MFAYHGDKFHESKRLPVFNTKAELEASPWAKYLKLVYGELPAETLGDDDHMNYPLDLNSTAILYHDKLEAAGIDDIGEPKAISLAGHDKDLLKRCPWWQVGKKVSKKFVLFYAADRELAPIASRARAALWYGIHAGWSNW